MYVVIPDPAVKHCVVRVVSGWDLQFSRKVDTVASRRIEHPAISLEIVLTVNNALYNVLRSDHPI